MIPLDLIALRPELGQYSSLPQTNYSLTNELIFLSDQRSVMPVANNAFPPFC